ncbi:MAG: hypothetical protein GEU75_09540 [Dehalococcoidia bacterium]|nr:hypothetical protein [Dehalococcoidia bacterium]
MKAKYLTFAASGFVGALALLVFAFNGSSGHVAHAQEPNLCLVLGVPSTQQFPFCVEVLKLTDPPGSTESFNFEAEINGNPQTFELTDTELDEIPVFPGDQVRLTEDVPEGWSLSIECEGDFELLDEGDDFIFIEVVFPPDQSPPSVLCTFTNSEEEDEAPAPRPNVAGAFAGNGGAAERNRARANAAGAAAAAAAQPAPATVRPPSTGDGGLLP